MRSANSWRGALTEDWQSGGFALYVHWPFCAAKCPYCDFNSHVAASVDQARWLQAYLGELDRIARLVPGRSLRSVYFGGGTPSLMEPATVAGVLERALSHWHPSNDIEITLEANPTSVEAKRFQGYASAGVNRVSMGIQALNDTDLRRLGRMHSVDEALRALDVAHSVFGRVNFDLIYARQDQTLEAWEAELDRALRLSADHLSLYQLTIEPETVFGARAAAGHLRGLPSEDLAADMYELTQQTCARHGLLPYEVSNFARPGNESRHNLVYWHYGDYAGIGPGAHGRLTVNGHRHATETWLAPGKWLELAEKGSGDSVFTQLSPQDQAGEYLMLGLRVSEGIDMERARTLWTGALPNHKISELIDLGLVEQDDHRLRTTASGRMVLNAVVEALLPD